MNAAIRFYEEPTVGKPTVLAHSKNSREASSFTCLRSRQYSVGLTIDSVSLIFILKVAKLCELFFGYFDKVYVVDAVYEEVFEAKFSEEIANIGDIKHLIIRKNPKKILNTNLGKGELAAISLAHEERIHFSSEDRKSHFFAASIGVKTISLLSILINARSKRKISKGGATEILFRLVEHGYYMSPVLFSAVLRKLEN